MQSFVVDPYSATDFLAHVPTAQSLPKDKKNTKILKNHGAIVTFSKHVRASPGTTYAFVV